MSYGQFGAAPDSPPRKGALEAVADGFVEAIRAVDAEISFLDRQRLSATADALIAACAEAGSRPRSLSRPSEVRDRARLHVSAHLREPGLSVEGVARHLGISVRALHLAFATEPETIGALIRRLRLERARDDLFTEQNERGLVGTVSRRWGFGSAASFARAFRREYGCSPLQWRRSKAESDPAVGTRNRRLSLRRGS
ncbi:helix-turn-helix transcriptional regulator [Planotetraspora sp. GP83]|uniref:helix-turn-helix transcriptional regulator n=1 Tax=Planotetraspora sp. GP83 TaxID=3156264 RepID=UPI0035163A2C